jgi:predicted ArsR family transcriptional regulator
MSARERARVHGVLAVPARVRILDRLRAAGAPMDAQAVADAEGMHVTTARFHLDALIGAGLARSEPYRQGGRGRPRTRYAASAQAEEPGDEPYRELADLLAAHFADTPAGRADRAELAGRDWAARRLAGMPSRAHSPASARQVVTGLFAEMGFDPEPDPDPEAGDRLLLHGCPFRDIARAHPDVVCAAHQGLLRGMTAGLDPAAPVPDLEPFARPQLCVIAFGTEPSTGSDRERSGA